MKSYKKRLENLEDIIKIQCSSGNWNYNEYMHGLANGLIMARSLFTDEEPEFLDSPKKWRKDYKGSILFRIKSKFFPRSLTATEAGQGVNVKL
jgi:hypothetical protein